MRDVRLGRSVLRVNRPVADHGGEGSAIIAIHSQGRLGILPLHLDVSSSSWKKIFGVKVKQEASDLRTSTEMVQILAECGTIYDNAGLLKPLKIHCHYMLLIRGTLPWQPIAVRSPEAEMLIRTAAQIPAQIFLRRSRGGDEQTMLEQQMEFTRGRRPDRR